MKPFNFLLIITLIPVTLIAGPGDAPDPGPTTFKGDQAIVFLYKLFLESDSGIEASMAVENPWTNKEQCFLSVKHGFKSSRQICTYQKIEFRNPKPESFCKSGIDLSGKVLHLNTSRIEFPLSVNEFKTFERDLAPYSSDRLVCDDFD